nr:RNA methyltransferase [uncultured Acidocella sp.]
MVQNRPPHGKNAPRQRSAGEARGTRPDESWKKEPRQAPARHEGPKRNEGQGRREAEDRTQAPARPDGQASREGAGRRESSRGAARRGPSTPSGAVWLYGTHAVAAALKNPERLFRRLVITEEAQASLAAEAKLPWPIQPEISPRERIDQILGAKPGSGIVHQGIALLADQLEAPSLQEALLRPGPVLVLDQIFDPRNVGALMRTAQAFGACAVVAQDRNAPEETGALAKAASGALETIPLLRITNIARTLTALKDADVWVVGLDGHSQTRLRGEAFAGRRVALVLGSEGEGMRRLTRETCDEICALAMPGGMESLNVSAAGAVALYELTRTPG